VPERVAGGKFNLKFVKIVENSWRHTKDFLPAVILVGSLLQLLESLHLFVEVFNHLKGVLLAIEVLNLNGLSSE
jgi:hypothetical protein